MAGRSVSWNGGWGNCDGGFDSALENEATVGNWDEDCTLRGGCWVLVEHSCEHSRALQESSSGRLGGGKEGSWSPVPIESLIVCNTGGRTYDVGGMTVVEKNEEQSARREEVLGTGFAVPVTERAQRSALQRPWRAWRTVALADAAKKAMTALVVFMMSRFLSRSWMEK